MTILLIKLPRKGEKAGEGENRDQRFHLRLLMGLVLTFLLVAYIIHRGNGAFMPAWNPPSSPPQQIPVKEEAPSEGKSSPGEERPVSQVDLGEPESPFFIEYRLERDRQRSQQINLLKQMGGGEEANKRLVELTQYMDMEMQLERLIRAKGYREAAVFIQPQAVSIVVLAEKFGPEDANKIGDLVSRTTGRPKEQISIIVKGLDSGKK